MPARKKSKVGARVVRKTFNPWTVFLYKGIDIKDRTILMLLILDWIHLKGPVKYQMRWLSALFGMRNSTMRRTLLRLQSDGWITYVSNKGRNVYGITVRITTNCIKTFKLPIPAIRLIEPETDLVKQLTKKERRARGIPAHPNQHDPRTLQNDSFNADLLIDTYPSTRNRIKEDRVKRSSLTDDDAQPTLQVRRLIDAFDDYMEKMGYALPRRYSPEQAQSDAESMIAERPLKEWLACIGWLRKVKKGLIKDEWVWKLKVWKVVTLTTVWNHYVDATKEGRTGKAPTKEYSLYDKQAGR